MRWHWGIWYLWISLLTAPLRAKNYFLALAASRVSQLHSPPANACPQPVSERLPMPVSLCIKAAPIWRWKAHSFPPAPKAGSTVKAGADVIGMTNMPEAKLAREA